MRLRACTRACLHTQCMGVWLFCVHAHACGGRCGRVCSLRSLLGRKPTKHSVQFEMLKRQSIEDANRMEELQAAARAMREQLKQEARRADAARDAQSETELEVRGVRASVRCCVDECVACVRALCVCVCPPNAPSFPAQILHVANRFDFFLHVRLFC